MLVLCQTPGWKGWIQVELVMLGPCYSWLELSKGLFVLISDNVSLSLRHMCNPTRIILLQYILVLSELQH